MNKILKEIEINYSDNKGYRKCLRDIFSMDSANYADKINTLNSQEKLDEETEDEMSYDDDSASKTMDEIYSKTKDDILFQEIYILAASKMFSEDPTIGQAVLFSYDFLPLYFLCLVDYLNAPEEFNKENINYVNLLKKIS
jgi:hypothetical protein